MTATEYAPAIFGLSGLQLLDAEKEFFATTQPTGFILFARNVDSPQQVKALTDSLKACVGREHVLILIDQEGGRVQRLKPPHWRRYLPMGIFADAYECYGEGALHALRLHTRMIASDLVPLGLTGNCLPLLDVPVEGSDVIIGDRAFGRDPKIVRQMGQAVCESLIECGLLPVMKHIPGHGRASVDSHLDLPVVTADKEALRRQDFAPFKALSEWGRSTLTSEGLFFCASSVSSPVSSPVAPLFAMTAHIRYDAFDPDAPATLSQTVIKEVIRGEIGFDGLLMTDDLSMKALGGSFEERAYKSLAAGCDLLLHCNGDMAEMQAVMRGIDGKTLPESAGLDQMLARMADLIERKAQSLAENGPALEGAYRDALAAVGLGAEPDL